MSKQNRLLLWLFAVSVTGLPIGCQRPAVLSVVANEPSTQASEEEPVFGLVPVTPPIQGPAPPRPEMPNPLLRIPDDWPDKIETYKGSDLLSVEEAGEYFTYHYELGWSWCIEDHEPPIDPANDLQVRFIACGGYGRQAQSIGYQDCKQAYGDKVDAPRANRESKSVQ